MSTDAAIANDVQPIRVLVVEDHDHVLWALRKLIEGEWPRMKVTAAVKSVREALAAIRRAVPDVVLLDLHLGEDNSLDHLEEFQGSGAAVVVLTGSRDDRMHRRALQGGARTVVLKEEPAEVLLQEIQRADEWRRSPRNRPARVQDCQSAVATRIDGFISSTTQTETKS